VSFYYFDLYDLRLLRERKKMVILLLGALGFGSVFLFFVYYLFPLFTVGRGMFIISQFVILLFCFLWRLVYPGVVRTLALKERILIVGTGKLARIIKREVTENGSDEFEIAGFVDENREKLGKRI
jgi:FlaA1/EpsC-like NDP-sugar epimerase